MTERPEVHVGRRRPGGVGWYSPLRVGVVALLLVAAVLAWGLTRGSAPAYRTAEVGTGTVVATLDSVAKITPVNQANLNFNVSGTVSSVDASVGQTVTAGQTLASLDIADLNASVVSAQATLASATATLARAEASETAATSASSSAATPTASTTAAASSAPTTPTSAGLGSTQEAQKIAGLQGAVVADQRQLDADERQATTSLKEATVACEAGAPTKAPTSPSPGVTGTPTCRAALSQATSAQAAIAAATGKLGQDERALDSALASSSGSRGSPAGGGTTRSGAGSGGAASGATTQATPTATAANTSPTASTSNATVDAGQGGGSGSGSPGKTATPQQLAVDQASIDTAQANLSDAQLALGGADLVSSISGTVASVSIAAGDSVTAGSGSTGAQIVVIGAGSSYDVSTAVPVADVGKVAVGQEALVTPDSTNTEMVGHVTSIGVLAANSSTTTTYPVTIALDSSELGQLSGAEADVEIIVERAANVTAVPSSAVRTVGSVHLVTVMDGTTTKATPVTLGTVGDVLTQVTSGVTPGERVVLANLDEPLPTTSTGSLRTGFGGGLGGGGLAGGGGGFGGGRFGG